LESPDHLELQDLKEKCKMGKLIKTLAAALVLCLGLTHATRADTFVPNDPASTGTLAIFDNVHVYGVDTSSNANPWGILCSTYQGASCLGNNDVIHTGADASQAFELATVTFTSNGFTIVPNTPATDKGSASVSSGISSIYSSSNLSPLQVLLNTTVTANGTWCTRTGCNTPGPGTIRLINALGTDVFVAVDDSFGMAFTLTSTPITTPEPSSLLMISSGLLGLMGLGLRRKNTA
jgi:hypothetical protein